MAFPQRDIVPLWTGESPEVVAGANGDRLWFAANGSLFTGTNPPANAWKTVDCAGYDELSLSFGTELITEILAGAAITTCSPFAVVFGAPYVDDDLFAGPPFVSVTGVPADLSDARQRTMNLEVQGSSGADAMCSVSGQAPLGRSFPFRAAETPAIGQKATAYGRVGHMTRNDYPATAASSAGPARISGLAKIWIAVGYDVVSAGAINLFGANTRINAILDKDHVNASFDQRIGPMKRGGGLAVPR